MGIQKEVQEYKADIRPWEKLDIRAIHILVKEAAVIAAKINSRALSKKK